jgi:NADH-quinone oxidoreductase subunit N
MPTGSMVVLVTIFTLIFSLYFFQLFLKIFYLYSNFFSQFFILGGILSLIFGFLGAFDQKLLKKFFIYSSIGHVAFLLFSFIAPYTFQSGTSLLMYLLIYLVSTFLLWFLITHNTKKVEFLSNLLVNIKENSLYFFLFVIIVFSMSGIPPLAGFFIKFDILSILALSNEFLILFTTLLITVASFYYYLRLVKISSFENFKSYLLQFLKIENF